MAKPGEDLLIGRRVAGKYEVLSVIGQGAMGIVYEARQVALDKVVALKVLAHRLRDDAEFVTRFHTEARAASRLDHPNSTRVLDFGAEPDGMLYIAMELLRGRTLQQVLEEEFPLAASRVASIMSQTLSAVGAAHTLGILHRDLKPENIVILEGHDEEEAAVEVVKVCDFGIAKLEGSAEPLGSSQPGPANGHATRATRAGVIVGTPQYMSPEQARGEELDERSDLYSLGVVLFEMLTGVPPFDRATPAEVMYRHMYTEPTRPSLLHSGVEPRLEAICLRALAKDKAQRYATAREMRAELRSLIRERSASLVEPTSAPPARTRDVSAPTIRATVSSPPPPPLRRRARRGVALALAAMLVVGVGFAVAKRRGQTSTARAAPAPASPPPSSQPPLERTAVQAPPASVSPAEHVEASPRLAGDRVKPGRTHPSQGVALVAEVVPAMAVHDEAPPAPAPVLTASSETAPIAPPPPVTATPPRSRPDPSRARVDVGRVQPERVTAASVEATMRHLDFTSCYRAALAQSQGPLEGTATLAIETDEDGDIVRANLVGGDFPAGLRQCVAARANGARVHDVDTGAAAAKVTLRFELR